MIGAIFSYLPSLILPITWRIGLEGHKIVLGIRNRLVLIEKHDRQDSQWHCLSQSCIHVDLSWETPAKSWSLPWSTIEFFKKKKRTFFLIYLDPPNFFNFAPFKNEDPADRGINS